MVIADLSAPETVPKNIKSKQTPIASVSDRFIAFILDFLIISPVVSLLMAGMIRQTKTFFLLDAGSSQGALAAMLVLASVFAVVVLLQTAFLYYWQATPGQLFLQLRVQAYPHEQERLSLNQALLRSLLWCSGFLLFAVPFLEIASHPLRRAFHERASDTIVVTLKKNFDDGPHPLESRFIASWMRMSFLFLLLVGVLGFFKTYYSLQAGLYKDSSAPDSLICKEMKDTDLVGAARLDAALALFLLDAVTSECLNKEADAFLWSQSSNVRDFAYLAKYVAASEAEQDKYLDKACETPSSSCALARYLADDGTPRDLEKAEGELWSVQLLKSEDKYTNKDFVGNLEILTELQKVPALQAALEKRFVRGVWALREPGKEGSNSKGRQPASATKNGKSFIELFKEKYEVP
ncbi:MAG: RDD family protein [Bdellovibrio sp.]|nr:RDD family protein [Bdellovibrio sp.]